MHFSSFKCKFGIKILKHNVFSSIESSSESKGFTFWAICLKPLADSTIH